MTEELKELLRYFGEKQFKKGIEVANQQWVIKATELQRHNMIKRIFYPICWVYGHKIDPIWRFCSRCRISEERLMK